MNAGDTVRYYCDECMTEFEVTLEPKTELLAEGEKLILQQQPKDIQCCPFCLSNNIESEEESS